MRISVSDTKEELGVTAARCGAEAIRNAVASRGEAVIVVATGASQFEMLSALVDEPELPWRRVTAFHLDEYVGMPVTHPASFRRYLRERFAGRLPEPLRAFHEIDGEGDLDAECRRLAGLIGASRVDAAFIGIGENGHLAFNDPPADFDTEEPYLIVELDEACRRQQIGEGWFGALDEVPTRAVSMSVRQILAARTLICSVPDLRKAEAVRKTVEGPVTPMAPASILQTHPAAHLFLDRDSASLLGPEYP